MTKEAKIGMLTGLGVIVAIGVLLSEYLGDRNTGPTAVPVATGKMATLPTGQAYRQQVMSPVNVPAMTPAGGGDRTQLPGGGETATTVATGNNVSMPPTMYAMQTDAMPAGPSVAVPVTPMPAGPTLMDGRSGGGPPILMLTDTTTVPVRLSTENNTSRTVDPARPAMATYVVQSGDTLAKIAKKFYNSSKNSDVARIVTANKAILKDANVQLMPNMKLSIPQVAPTAPTTPAAPAAAAVPAPRPVDPGVVHAPTNNNGVVPIPGVVLPPRPVAVTPRPLVVPTPTPVTPAPVAKTYTVQNGDTLEKIAKMIAPTKVNETVTKLVSLNGIKDASKLKVGQVLKVPA